jgi:hypothetical protein
MMVATAKQWKLKSGMLYYNRGCEGLSVGILANRGLVSWKPVNLL